MRIGLYGMPTAGKTYILDKLDFIEVVVGSRLLREYDPEFDQRDEAGREKDRKAVANIMMSKPRFIMDGHYAFGNETAFTEDEGKMYDVYIYLYIDPKVLRERMEASEKNRKYLKYDIAEWQNREIQGLRTYCHEHNKDFYIADNPPENRFADVHLVVDFIRDITNGFSSLEFAKKRAGDILSSTDSAEIVLADGDKTLTIEDSSYEVFGYTTHLFDGNFYTGYQSWKQWLEFSEFTYHADDTLPVHLRDNLIQCIDKPMFILTSGHNLVWEQISKKLNAKYYYGNMMSAEAKYFITKILQEAGRKVIAYGDGMNDYYMLKQADEGYLVRKKDGSVSRSLKNRDLGGLRFV
jgi:broad-specificity NMP kinase